MRFWDSSAVVPLLVEQPSSSAVTRELTRDPLVLVWWSTRVECASAIARLERDGHLGQADVPDALARLDALTAAWHEVLPVEAVRRAAARLLRVHPLRAADSLQLAAALVASEGRPDSLPFATLDDQLRQAAEREGFPTLVPRE